MTSADHVVPSAARAEIVGSLPIRGGWIEGDHGVTGAAWFWPRTGNAPRTAVLLVNAIAHEERTMCGGVVTLGHALADAGFASLLIDLTGTLQSDGSLDAEDIGARWRADIQRGVRHLREAGFSQIIVVGVRVGALLAFDALVDDPVLGMVAWSPILSGRRFVRELKVLQGTSHVEVEASSEQICVAGFDLSKGLLEHLGGLDSTRLARTPARHVLILDSPSTPLDKWVGRLESQGAIVDRAEPTETEAWLARTDALPILPFSDIQTLTAWCKRLRQSGDEPITTPTAPDSLATTVSFEHRGQRIRETVVDIDPGGLCGVLSEPEGRPSRGMTLLLLSTVGPGRCFTSFARDEAARGRTSLRFDPAGFGLSDRRTGPFGGEVYTLPGRTDVIDAVNHLHARGHRSIAMLGFCASAWSMIQAGPLPGVRAAMALNVALYVDPGRAADHNPATPVAAPKWLSEMLGDRLLKRVVGKLRRIMNLRKQPIGWLEQFGQSGVDVLLGFSDHDPGQTYLHRQLGRVLRRHLRSGLLQLRTYPGLGHLLEHPMARAQAFEDMRTFLLEVDRKLSPSQDAAPSSQVAGAAGPCTRDAADGGVRVRATPVRTSSTR